jgi:hypothetical protein
MPGIELMDVALHQLNVTFIGDRAEIRPDGSSHYGMRDVSLPSLVPGLRIGASRDAEQLGAQPKKAVTDTRRRSYRDPASGISVCASDSSLAGSDRSGVGGAGGPTPCRGDRGGQFAPNGFCV